MAVQATEAGVQLNKRFFTVEEYTLMGDVGVFKPEERVELILGEIYTMNPIGDRHACVVTNLQDLFYEKVRKSAKIRIQSPIVLQDCSQPLPDQLLLKRPQSAYNKHPRPEDVYLLIEVSDTTLDTDRNIKCPLYARNWIEEYWIVNLEKDRIEAYRDPDGERYLVREIYKEGESVSPMAFPNVRFAVNEILG